MTTAEPAAKTRGIDWTAAQAKLQVRIDGQPGPRTYDALCAYIAGRPMTAVDDRIGASCAQNMPRFGQDATPQRTAEFLAQCCNETGGWRAWEENLSYSASGMCRTWPSHFIMGTAAAAVGRPDVIASRAYGGRMGNAPYPSRDGYTYRGRGALQLTGKDNYRRFGDLLGVDLLTHPELAAEPDTSILIALEFFKLGAVNAAIDRGDFRQARRITNGGDIGLGHVAELRNRALAVLA